MEVWVGGDWCLIDICGFFLGWGCLGGSGVCGFGGLDCLF